MDLEKFQNDVYEITERLSKNLNENDLPKLFLVQPHARDQDKISKIISFCDIYYKNPPIPVDDILNARLHSV